MNIEIRSTGEAVISGYVNCVERDSSLLPPSMCPKAKKNFIERVREGAFRRALRHGDSVELRFNHEKVIGSTEGKSLTLYEDGVGLFARAVISDPEVIEKAKNGELRGWSFGFSDAADQWEAIDAETDRRYLNSFRLKAESNPTVQYILGLHTRNLLS